MTELPALLNAELDGRYRVVEEVGRGGMAVVFRAEDLRHGRHVAIKALLPDLAGSTGAARFRQEIEMLAALRHPGILPLIDSGVVEGIPFFVMPLVEGETLADRLERQHQLPVEEALRLGVEVADALAHAHSRGLVHRDVKPSNIMLDAGHAVVTDFGIALAHYVPEEERNTITGGTPGSPLYMSPEQAGGSDHLDGRSDIYSLACVLYEALAGDPPFTGRVPQAILARKVAGDAPSLRAVRQAVSPVLDTVIGQALARDPGDRFSEATAFRDALQAVLDGREVGVHPALAASGVPHSTHLAARGPGPRTPAQTVAVWAIVTLGVLLFIPVVGLFTRRVFDITLGIPDRFGPVGGDVLVVGVRALIPPFIFGGAAIFAFVVVRYLAAALAWLLRRSRSLGATLDATREVLRSSGSRALATVRPETLAEVYFLVSVTVGAAVLLAFAPYFQAMFAGDPEPLTETPFQLYFTPTLTAVIVALFVGWIAVGRRLERMPTGSLRVGVARWASLGWLLFLLLIATGPWLLLHGAEFERVRLEGRPAYLVAETASEYLLFDPESARTLAVARAEAPRLERLGTVGNPYEGREAFETSTPPD